ncbi:MAG: patatin-like phospholipase family protein [Deltaproteobacteria bacterium]|nr:patatin-like phospholipase family protein [Deltaproteobacteria bacterium]
MATVGLVLSGGGARAAYQVGALQGIAEILGEERTPFRVMAGISAGAINTSALAIGADSFAAAVARLRDVWMSLTPDRVYRTDLPRLSGIGLQWMKDLATGGKLGRSSVTHLLDTSPLRKLLEKQLDMSQIGEQVRRGILRGYAVSATNYFTGSTNTFFDAAPGVKTWVRRGRLSIRGPVGVEHVMASAAIPVFFPPVQIDGRYYGDGGVRMTTPISPAIHLGAEKIVAIGIRYQSPDRDTLEANEAKQGAAVSLSEIAGVMLNSVFLDSLEDDLDRLERMNRTLAFVPDAVRQGLPDQLRRIPALALKPSQDLGKLASDQYEAFPLALRHLLRGIGASESGGLDLLSYLAFQPGYVGRLIELGRKDTLARQHEIASFFAQQAEDFAPPSMLPPGRLPPRSA